MISPNKTIEEPWVACCVLCCFMGLYGLILTKAFQFDVIYWYGAVYGVLGCRGLHLGIWAFPPSSGR